MTDYSLPDLPYDYDALEPFLSKQVLEWHHDVHHQGYVNGWKGAEEALEEQRLEGEFTETGSILSSFTHNFAGHVLHELFWNNMDPDGGGEPDGALRKKIEDDFGSVKNWRREFEAAARAASGWALLVYIPYTDELHTVAVDRHDEGAVWGAHPILALDVWEHSYYHDYGPDRGMFIEQFFDVIDWDDVESRFEEIAARFDDR